MFKIPVFLSFFILILSSLNAQATFWVADSFEREKIQNSMRNFYAEQLVEAGLFENEKSAREAACIELDQDQMKPGACIFYSTITSEDRKIQYGYFVYSLKDHIAYLDAIYLEKQHRGQGIGKKILQNLDTFFLTSGVHVLKLYVFNHNKRAMALYHQIGYEIETTYYINDRPVGHHMKKNI